jgi:RNA polymerase-binding transcription factor DksA
VQFPEYGSDEEENAAEVADYETNLSIDAGLKKSYRDVLSALKRMEEGTYGLCKYCGKLIPEERLRARPTSSSCVTCKKAITQEA